MIDQHPIQGGSRDTLSGLMLQKSEISAGLMGHLAHTQTLPLPEERTLRLSNLSATEGETSKLL